MHPSLRAESGSRSSIAAVAFAPEARLWPGAVPLAAGLVAVACLASALVIARSPVTLLLFGVTFGLFTAPGWPLARWLLGSGASRLARAPFALLLGYAAGLTLYLLLRIVHATWPALVLAACLILALGLTRALGAPREGLFAPPSLTRADGLALAVLLGIVVLIVGPVFANVGRETTDGLAYRAYFIADLFAHMSVVSELAKGATPPVNPYLPTEALPYYWSFFTFPALFDHLHDTLRASVTVDRGILLTDLSMALVYASVWFLTLRALGASTLAALAGWLLVLVASSFEGVFYLWSQWRAHRAFEAFRYVNIDAITRWKWDLPPTDGLHRLFWYTPQHGLAITLGLLAVAAPALARRPNGLPRGLLDGLLLGVAFACSSFNGLMLVLAYALFECVLLARARFADAAAWLRARVLAAVIVLAYAGLTIALGMIQRESAHTIFGLNAHFMRGPWAFLALSFGPALLLAPFGLPRLGRLAPRALAAGLALGIVSALTFLFVDIRGHENTYVTFRAAQFGYLLLAIGAAFAIDASRAWARPAAWTLAGLATIGSLGALPTVAMDWFNARDITNRDMSPGGFPWTVYITPENRAAALWIAANLPEDAVVQTDASTRGRSTWALVPAIAERRLSVGLGLFEPNPRRFDQNIARIRLVFRSPDLDLAYGYCQRLGIEYLYVGPEEVAAHGPNTHKFAADPARFTPVYQTGEVTIYRVNGVTPLPLGGAPEPRS